MTSTPESATSDDTRADEETGHEENLPRNEKATVEQGIPTEVVGNTTDIPSRDWVGSGHSGPDDESLEDPDDESRSERADA